MPASILKPDTRSRDQRIADALFRAIAAMVLVSLALATFARVTGMEPAGTPAPSAVVAERLVVIEGTLDDAATILNEDGSRLAVLAPEHAGFINGVYRALARERMLREIDGNPAVRITRFADGRLTLNDPATGWRVELIGFGNTNRDAFAALLD